MAIMLSRFTYTSLSYFMEMPLNKLDYWVKASNIVATKIKKEEG
ncbi:hypothetical protein REA38_11685 [Serratia sp. MF2]|nr:hypothetical protein [Serratia sp. MF1(2023)]MDQ7104211.1 hypothetical protein [Serratia sp. MF1(2023)]